MPLPDAVIDHVLKTLHSTEMDGILHGGLVTANDEDPNNLPVPYPYHRSNLFTSLARMQMRFAAEALVSYETKSSPAAHAAIRQVVFVRARDPVIFGDERLASDKTFADRFPSDQLKIGGQYAVQEWEKCLGQEVRVLEAPGDHFTMFDQEHVSFPSHSDRG